MSTGTTEILHQMNFTCDPVKLRAEDQAFRRQTTDARFPFWVALAAVSAGSLSAFLANVWIGYVPFPRLVGSLFCDLPSHMFLLYLGWTGHRWCVEK